MQQIPSRPPKQTNRLQQLNRHFATSSINQASQDTSDNYNMASSDPKSHNNADFTLDALFGVKGKVALITGGGSGIGLMFTQALAVNGVS